MCDELCYQWAREYFRDADAKEDAEQKEKFIPKTYNGKVSKTGKGKKEKSKKTEPKPAPKPADEEQLTFGDFGTEGSRIKLNKRACRHGPYFPHAA